MELIPALDRFLVENVKGVSIDAQAVLSHVNRQPKYDGVSSDGEGQRSTELLQPVQPAPGLPYYLDVGAFGVALENALQDVVAGYVVELRQSGKPVYNATWQFAKRPQDDGGRGEPWAPHTQMHVASVSKLMTAMAMTVLLGDNNISPDAPIIDYLPDYWAKGPNIEYIVFRNLFNHTSGLSPSSNDPVDFSQMQSAIAGGIDLPEPGVLNLFGLGHYNYQNLNYGLCRILLAVINGNINKNTVFPIDDGAINDALWDVATIRAYEAYLQAKVFTPSGVVDATLDHPSTCALAYREPDDTEAGWNSGSMQESCGCDGWHLSVDDLLNVMGEFRRRSGILPPDAAQEMLDNGFGVDPLTGNSPLPTAFFDARRQFILQARRLARSQHQPGRTEPRVFFAAGYGVGGVR
jgi:hypothetical protein